MIELSFVHAPLPSNQMSEIPPPSPNADRPFFDNFPKRMFDASPPIFVFQPNGGCICIVIWSYI